LEPSNTPFISRSRGEFRLERKSAVAFHAFAKLFKMDFESGTLLGRVILGPAQGDDRIESVFAARRAALPTVRTSMVYQQDRNALTPQFQQPVLHRQPRIAGTLAAICAERGKIVEDDEVNATQQLINRALPFL
jgi:hypothetical protein